jgi:hypothetical protein
MKQIINFFFGAFWKSFFPRQQLILENIALRHQLMVYQRNGKKLKLNNSDRAVWVLLSRFLSTWKELLVIVKSNHRNLAKLNQCRFSADCIIAITEKLLSHFLTILSPNRITPSISFYSYKICQNHP